MFVGSNNKHLSQMKTKHTPGPWTADGTRIKAYRDNGYTKICKVGDVWPARTDEANARLIAAAPELLEELMSARESMLQDKVAYNQRLGADYDTAYAHAILSLSKIDAVITKATSADL